jgi:hypothetical protein
MSYATESPIFGFGNWMATSGLMLGVSSHSKAGINCPLPLPPPMLQMHVSSVSDVIRVMLQVFYMDVAKYIRMLHILPVFQRHVASVSEACSSVCSKYFICFRRMLQAFWYGCCTCFTHMLQEYVRNVSVVSVLCCNKCCHIVSCKCFISMLHMFHTHCKCMFQTFHQWQS